MAIPLHTDSQKTSTQTSPQWFLKHQGVHGGYDSSYKVLPTLNLQQRVRTLEKITKDNHKLYSRLQNIQSQYGKQKVMTSYDRNDTLRKRLSKYDSTRPKMDPLFVKHAKNFESQKRVKSRVQEMITNVPT